MSQHAAPAEKGPVERKVWWASLGTLGASVGAAVLNALLADPGALSVLPGWATFVLIAAAPPIVQFLAGYAAPHTLRSDPAVLEAARRQREREGRRQE